MWILVVRMVDTNCSRHCVASFPGVSHIACLVCILVGGALTFAGLVMGSWVEIFVNSDITGCNSELTFLLDN